MKADKWMQKHESPPAAGEMTILGSILANIQSHSKKRKQALAMKKVIS